MATNIELYEALKGHVGQEAARMIADAVPAAEGIATRADVDRLETRIETVEQRLDVKIDSLEQRLDVKIDSLEQRLDAKIDSLEQRLDAKIGSVEHRLLAAIHETQAKATRAMLGFFIPLWFGVWATVAALVFKLP